MNYTLACALVRLLKLYRYVTPSRGVRMCDALIEDIRTRYRVDVSSISSEPT